MNTEIDLIKNDLIDQATIQVIAQRIKEDLKEGLIDPLKLQVKFKSLEKIQESVKEALRRFSIDAYDKYGEKEVEVYGAVFRKGEFGTKYDYEACNDPEWMRLNADALFINKALKERELFLRGLTKPEVMVDKETGEILTVFPPPKKSTTAISCSI